MADRKFLIVDLLPKEEPDTGDWTSIQLSSGSNTLAFQYHYDVLLGSVIELPPVDYRYLQALEEMDETHLAHLKKINLAQFDLLIGD